MKFVEYVPDYILRDLQLADGRRGVKVGMSVTICEGSRVHVQIPKMPEQHGWDMTLTKDVTVTLSNFLPGYTEIYAPHAVHNHQVVWIENNSSGEPWYYHSTDINNVKEVRDAA